jgi:2-amino-4-hydroxy-6-hydroxymethyldihydropteridine diphosphokinase
MSAAASIDLPPWAVAGEKRRAHIARVTALLDQWARALRVDDATRAAWRDAGRFHDALRDAPEPLLRRLTGDRLTAAPLLHGPAAAVKLETEGEERSDVLDAVRWHTVGSKDWARTGRALFMADFLEPGRKFDREIRAALAADVPDDFDGTFRRVVQNRIAWTLREGRPLDAETSRLWDSVR